MATSLQRWNGVFPGKVAAVVAVASGQLSLETVEEEWRAQIERALEAGLTAGGEAGPVHSTGMAVHDHDVWPCVDLRIDWTDGSVTDDLRALWQRYQPQMKDYINRARNPKDAPSYGVPGDP